MSVLSAFLCTIIGGALGGTAVLLANISYLGSYGARIGFSHESKILSLRTFRILLSINAIIGVTGAFALILAIALLEKFPTNQKSEDFMFVTGLAVLGGFGARRFLPMMVINLEETVRRIVSRNKEEIIRATQQMNKDTLLLSTAASALTDNASEADREFSESALKEAIKNETTDDVNAFILLARLQRKSGDLIQAVDTLTTLINKNPEAVAPSSEMHTALYNRACYYSLIYGKTKDNVYISHAIADLSSALKFGANRTLDVEFALNDTDFAPIREDPRFKDLLSK